MHRGLRSIAVGLVLWGLLPQPLVAQTARPSLADPSLLLGPVLVLAVALWAMALWTWRRRNHLRTRDAAPPQPPGQYLAAALLLTLIFAYMYGYAVAQGRAAPLLTLIGALSPQAIMMAFLMIVTAFFLRRVCGTVTSTAGRRSSRDAPASQTSGSRWDLRDPMNSGCRCVRAGTARPGTARTMVAW